MIIRAAAHYTLRPGSGEEAVVPGMELLPKPMARRMIAPVRRTMACALAALAEAGIERPDAICYGTGLGCLADTREFLLEIERNAGSLLAPTSVMRSTHNTVAGLIALALKAQGPNLTFSQGFTSFHAALLAALMHLERRPGDRVLVGASDEHLPLLDHLFDALHGAAHVPAGARPAEGAAFFVLGGADGPVKGRVVDVRMGPADRVPLRDDAPVWTGALVPAAANGASYVHRTGLHHSAPAVAMALALADAGPGVQLMDREGEQHGLIHVAR
ncbi:MAG: beta-ketoacyl synthase chain length factor [Flavobacteriales bacterium]|nr:beta-ketoacyl synthase chain length factor [Flavobacteriales bacterium]